MTNYIHTKSLFAFFLGRLLYVNSIPFRPTYYLAFLCKNKCSIVEERMCKKVPLTNSPLTPPFNFRLRLLRLKAWCKRHILRYKSFEIFSQIVLVLKVFWFHSFSLTIYIFPIFPSSLAWLIVIFERMTGMTELTIFSSFSSFWPFSRSYIDVNDYWASPSD